MKTARAGWLERRLPVNPRGYAAAGRIVAIVFACELDSDGTAKAGIRNARILHDDGSTALTLLPDRYAE